MRHDVDVRYLQTDGWVELGTRVTTRMVREDAVRDDKWAELILYLQPRRVQTESNGLVMATERDERMQNRPSKCDDRWR